MAGLVGKNPEELGEGRAKAEQQPAEEGRFAGKKGKQKQGAPETAPNDPLIQPGQREFRLEVDSDSRSGVRRAEEPGDQAVDQGLLFRPGEIAIEDVRG